MNERIKDLYEKALGTDEYGFKFDPAKFAELIVRECAWAADFADKEPGDYILKRFGIEE